MLGSLGVVVGCRSARVAMVDGSAWVGAAEMIEYPTRTRCRALAFHRRVGGYFVGRAAAYGLRGRVASKERVG